VAFAARTPALRVIEHPDFGSLANTSFVQDSKKLLLLSSNPAKEFIRRGARTTASLIDAGLVDELRLIVLSADSGEGSALCSKRNVVVDLNSGKFSSCKMDV